MAVEKLLLNISCDNWLVVFGVLVAILLRNITTLHPYSGQGNPPMYGDYEAQRHWMEITTNLPFKEWYHNTTDNNLEYWGLDYPPLTAYHMYLCGKIASYINVNYTTLHDSRGYESEDHKFFMRVTVLISDILVYIPSLIVFYYTSEKFYGRCSSEVKCAKKNSIFPLPLAAVLGMLYPGIIVVDHGHFQYNCVSLGLTTFAVVFLMHEWNIFASIFFCLALNYKQMELYHSLPFFFYLLSTCIPKPGKKALSGIVSLLKLAVTVSICFFVIWYPFIFDVDNALQVLHRQFPFARGIFEDKVANFWCFLNVVYKLKECDHSKLMRICLFTTLSAVFPSSVDLFLRPNLKKFLLALINSSLAFFLFSYQVHEKTILVVALPVLLYFPENPFVCFWFLYISVFSMIPLFVKDELVIATIGLLLFYTISFFACVKHYYQRYKNVSEGPYEHCTRTKFLKDILNLDYKKVNQASNIAVKIFMEVTKSRESMKNFIFFSSMLLSLLTSICMFIISLIMEPPKRYPDLFPLLISVYSCWHFIGFFIYFNIKQLQISQDFGVIENVKLKEN